jgi:pimeloyl-ACP methyl ester carboxylesterase
MGEIDVRRGDRVLRVRDAGGPDGRAVLYFHGTPGSRLDLGFGEDLASGRGVRLVSFDRPGYGGSTPAPFGLASVAADAHAIADELGIDRFATLGFSGGGPFALATAAGRSDRVSRVGIASGAGPFQLVPGLLDRLDDTDSRAVSLLPTDPAAAAAVFGEGFGPLAELARDGDDAALVTSFEGLLSPRDSELLHDQRYIPFFARAVRESLRPGVSGAAWDNVSWIGPWGFDLGDVRCPVLLWYGDEDRMAPPSHGEWLTRHLPDAKLTVRAGIGHLGHYEHLAEALDELTAP